jgi:hypothetical protein
MTQHKIVCICGKCNPEAIKQELLHEYTAWLIKNGYTDTDPACEESLAVDEFLKEQLNKKNNEKTKSI